MKYRKITAIVRAGMLEDIESIFIDMKVKGVTVTQVSGYGEYHNFFRNDTMSEHSRIEIFCRAEEAEGLAQAIMDAAHIGQPGDGIVSILPVEQLYNIRTKAELFEVPEEHE